MLVEGVISPVELLMLRPAGALNVPPVNVPVPVSVTACGVALLAQNGVA